MKLELISIDDGYITFKDDTKKKKQRRTIGSDLVFMYRNKMWIVDGKIFEVERNHKLALHFEYIYEDRVYYKVGTNDTIHNRIICLDGHFNHKGVRYQVIQEIIVKEEK